MKKIIKKGEKSSGFEVLPNNTNSISLECSHGNFSGLRIKLSNANGRSRTEPISTANKIVNASGFPIIEFEAESVSEDLEITLLLN